MYEQTVSVIVPVYNCEKYLERCVDSLVNQTYGSLEIILVDDGSSDGSWEVCERLAKADKRVICERLPENAGVSAARNKGLSLCHGKFITFVDADDWLEKNAIEYLADCLERSGKDIATCGFVRDSSNGKSEECCQFAPKVADASTILDPFSDEFQGIASCKLYRRSVIFDGGIRFHEDIAIGEDRLFWYTAVIKCRQVFVSSTPLYHYCYNENSAMSSLNCDKRYNDFVARKRIIELVKHDKSLYRICVDSAADSALEYLVLCKDTSTDKAKETRAFVRFAMKSYALRRRVRIQNRVYAVLSCISLKLLKKVVRCKHGI